MGLIDKSVTEACKAPKLEGPGIYLCMSIHIEATIYIYTLFFESCPHKYIWVKLPRRFSFETSKTQKRRRKFWKSRFNQTPQLDAISKPRKSWKCTIFYMLVLSANDYLVVWGPVVWILRVPLRIPSPFIGGSNRNPNHWAPNQQLTHWLIFEPAFFKGLSSSRRNQNYFI